MDDRLYIQIYRFVEAEELRCVYLPPHPDTDCFPYTCEDCGVQPLHLRTVPSDDKRVTFLDLLPPETKVDIYKFVTDPSHKLHRAPCKVCTWNALFSTTCILHTRCPVFINRESLSILAQHGIH